MASQSHVKSFQDFLPILKENLAGWVKLGNPGYEANETVSATRICIMYENSIECSRNLDSQEVYIEYLQRLGIAANTLE